MSDVVPLGTIFNGLKIGVVGAIGAGKSTLGENICKMYPGRIRFLTEFLNRKMLQTYIADPKQHAAAFQQSMVQNALNRQAFADLIVSLEPQCAVLIERPMVENVAFAMANHLMGYMTDAHWQFYQLMIEEEINLPQYRCDILCILFISDTVSYERMGTRSRPGEEKYTNRYLNILYRVHFIMILGWIMNVVTNRQRICIIPNDPFCTTDEALFKMETALRYGQNGLALIAPSQLEIHFRQRDEELTMNDGFPYHPIDWDEYQRNWRSDIAACEVTENIIVQYLNLSIKVYFLCNDPESARRCCTLDAAELKRWF